MKRFTLWGLALAFVLGTAAIAGATEIKVSGEFQAAALWRDNTDFVAGEDETTAAGANEDDFAVLQRMRNYFSFVANENLKAVWGVEIGTSTWGNANGSGTSTVGKGTGFGVDGDGVNVETKWAYLDYVFPGTKVGMRVGLQPIAFPTAVGVASPIHAADSAGVVLTTPFNDMISLTAAWTRLSDNTTSTTETTDRAFDDSDAFLLALPVKLNGFNVTPWGAYASIGSDSNTADLNAGLTTAGIYVSDGTSTFSALSAEDTADIWWGGVAFSMNAFDPFIVDADLVYGSMEASPATGDDVERAGWLFDLSVAYKGLDFGTPKLTFVYTSGEDGDSDRESERIPFLMEDFQVPGTMWQGGSAFDLVPLGADMNDLTFVGNGQMLVSLGLYGMSFVDNLKHDIVVSYAMGTNDEDSAAALINANVAGARFGQVMTEEDSLWEIDFNSQYEIYQQLSAILELGYISPSFDEGTWEGVGVTNADDTTSAWKVALGLKYKY